jgi:hypothetical protein
MKLIIRDNDGLVAQIDNYDGQVPRAGDYIFYPPMDDTGTGDISTRSTNVMSVKTVTWGIIMREPGFGYFTGRTEQIVEVWV